MWLKLRPLASETVTLLPPARWNANWAHCAEFLWRVGGADPALDVRVYAYSWGCGHGFVRLAKELARRGLRISKAVLCDPVYYGWGRWWRAVVFSPAIVIPPNVREVHWLRQQQNRPRSAPLKWNERVTTVHEYPPLACIHQYADDHPRFHRVALAVAHDQPVPSV